jgi:hypothetical protein
VELVAREDPSHASARARYLARLPAAAPRFDFADFELFRLRPAEVHFVAGFGRAHRLSGEVLAVLAARWPDRPSLTDSG